jgi:phospholipid/cholesterol/gamma-HCH transport system substrate-binding protein
MAANRKALVGLFVLGGLFLFALGLFWIGDRRLLFSDNIELQTQFAKLSGLEVGATVFVAGMNAGEILSIQVPPRPSQKFVVRFRVLEHFRPILRTDSVASIQMEGIVGNKVLQIDAGTENAEQAPPGSTIPSREPVEISAVIDQAVDLLKKVDVAVDDVQGRVVKTVDAFTEFGIEAQDVVSEVGDETKKLVATGSKIADDIDVIVRNVRDGRGTVGKLFNDDRMYESVRGTIHQVEQVAANANATSDDIRKFTADLQSRNLGEKIEKTASNIQDATGQLKEILREIQPQGSQQEGLLANVQATLDNTREATGDLAENMEALKRNWFFRGFFRGRGFFDADSINLEDYKEGKIAPKRDRERFWLHGTELFTTGAAGVEALSEAGKAKLAEQMVPYLRYIPNTLMIVEGYAGQGSESEQFLRSRDRARLVREYLVNRFGMKPSYVGVIPMGAVASSGPVHEIYEGVSVVIFPEADSPR